MSLTFHSNYFPFDLPINVNNYSCECHAYAKNSRNNEALKVECVMTLSYRCHFSSLIFDLTSANARRQNSLVFIVVLKRRHLVLPWENDRFKKNRWIELCNWFSIFFPVIGRLFSCWCWLFSWILSFQIAICSIFVIFFSAGIATNKNDW